MADKAKVDPGNRFYVRRHTENHLRIGRSMTDPLLCEITDDEALNLAAWIVALVDLDGKQLANLVQEILVNGG